MLIQHFLFAFSQISRVPKLRVHETPNPELNNSLIHSRRHFLARLIFVAPSVALIGYVPSHFSHTKNNLFSFYFTNFHNTNHFQKVTHNNSRFLQIFLILFELLFFTKCFSDRPQPTRRDRQVFKFDQLGVRTLNSNIFE